MIITFGEVVTIDGRSNRHVWEPEEVESLYRSSPDYQERVWRVLGTTQEIFDGVSDADRSELFLLVSDLENMDRARQEVQEAVEMMEKRDEQSRDNYARAVSEILSRSTEEG